MSAAADGAGRETGGRTRVTSKALNRIVSAVTAEALGVDAKHVGVDLSDDAGALALTVSTPVRVVALPRIGADAKVVARTGGTVLDRARDAQHEIRSRVTELTGSRIASVVVHVTGATIQEEARVR